MPAGQPGAELGPGDRSVRSGRLEDKRNSFYTKRSRTLAKSSLKGMRIWPRVAALDVLGSAAYAGLGGRARFVPERTGTERIGLARPGTICPAQSRCIHKRAARKGPSCPSFKAAAPVRTPLGAARARAHFLGSRARHHQVAGRPVDGHLSDIDTASWLLQELVRGPS
jgi:hypothetical protein